MRIGLLWLCGLFIAACSTSPPQKDAINHYLGRDISIAIGDHGPQYHTKVLPDGLTAYTWVLKEQGLVSASWGKPVPVAHVSGKSVSTGRAPGKFKPPQIVELTCVFSLVADADLNVVGWRTIGTGCYGAMIKPTSPNTDDTK